MCTALGTDHVTENILMNFLTHCIIKLSTCDCGTVICRNIFNISNILTTNYWCIMPIYEYNNAFKKMGIFALIYADNHVNKCVHSLGIEHMIENTKLFYTFIFVLLKYVYYMHIIKYL